MTQQPPDQPSITPDRAALRDQARILLERLIQAYPRAFFPAQERRIQPLKLGIHKALAPVIREWGFSAAALRQALAGYTRQLRYQMALLKAPQRIDLQGESAGEISEGHRQTARQRIASIQAKHRDNARAAKPRPGKSPPTRQDGISPEAVAALQRKLSRKATL